MVALKEDFGAASNRFAALKEKLGAIRGRV